MFDRFPALKFYFAEADCGWILVQMTDDWYLRWYHDKGVRMQKLPSEYWRDHALLLPLGPGGHPEALRVWPRPDHGAGPPHSTGSFPHSHEVIDSRFEGAGERAARSGRTARTSTSTRPRS